MFDFVRVFVHNDKQKPWCVVILSVFTQEDRWGIYVWLLCVSSYKKIRKVSLIIMCGSFEYLHAARTQLDFIPWFVFCVWICKKISESRVCVCLATECLYTGKQVFVCVTTLSVFIQIDNWSLRPYIWLSALSVFIQKNRRTILSVCVNIFSVFMLESKWRLYLRVRQRWTSSYGKTMYHMHVCYATTSGVFIQEDNGRVCLSVVQF